MKMGALPPCPRDLALCADPGISIRRRGRLLSPAPRSRIWRRSGCVPAWPCPPSDTEYVNRTRSIKSGVYTKYLTPPAEQGRNRLFALPVDNQNPEPFGLQPQNRAIPRSRCPRTSTRQTVAAFNTHNRISRCGLAHCSFSSIRRTGIRRPPTHLPRLTDENFYIHIDFKKSTAYSQCFTANSPGNALFTLYCEAIESRSPWWAT